MAKAHRMTPKRRAALRKAQAASARKRKGHGKATTKKATSKKTTAPKRKRSGLHNAARTVALRGAIAGGALLAMHQAGNYAVSKSNKTFSPHGYMNGQPTRQSGPHWMQFYGAGMSYEKKVRGFKRHAMGYLNANPHLKGEWHMRGQNHMAYGNPHGPKGPVPSQRGNIHGQKAITSGRRRRR